MDLHSHLLSQKKVNPDKVLVLINFAKYRSEDFIRIQCIYDTNSVSGIINLIDIKIKLVQNDIDSSSMG